MALPESVVKLIDAIAVKERIQTHSLKTDAGSNHGDGFIGQMFAVKLIGTKEMNGKTENVTYNLLCKVPPNSSVRRDFYQTSFAFQREIEMYTKILPMFDAFQREKGLQSNDRFDAYPKVYAAHYDDQIEHQVLVMDDLRSKNFQMFARRQSTDIEHATLVLTELAKYHAISFALKDQQPNLFDQLKRKDVYLEMLMESRVCATIDESLDRCYGMLKNERHKQVLADLKANYLNYIERSTKEEEIGDSGVMVHGDSWNNNFLFQYKNSEDLRNPQAITFVDWQLSRYISPLIDIYIFISSATDKSFRKHHYRDLMHIYHSALSRNIEKMGSDPEKLFPLQKFESELKKYAWYGLYFGSFMGQFVMADPEHLMDVEEYCERLLKGEKVNLLSNFDANEAFSTHINDLYEDFFDYGYF